MYHGRWLATIESRQSSARAKYRPMNKPAPKKNARPRRSSGLAHWMRRVLAEVAHAEGNLSPGAVHDLRVALRRCRTLAAGLAPLDPHPAWDKMARHARRLFRRLSGLRDAQVMAAWLARLAPAGDPVRRAMQLHLGEDAARRQRRTRRALRRLDSEQWRSWMALLSARARLHPAGGSEFRRLALEKCEEARSWHRAASRYPSPTVCHLLRIALKRFRYTVENFLPAQHAVWGRELKKLQDLLGEIHDLDVLWSALPEAGDAFSAPARRRWRARIQAERAKRFSQYRARIAGKRSLWNVWRAALSSES